MSATLTPATSVAPTVLPSAPAEGLSLRDKTVVGIGGLPIYFGNITVQSMAIPFYQMTLHVNPTLLGLALTLPRLWDAMIDPLVGNISDNFRSRFGRRRPFIVAGALAMGLAYGLIWMVPPDWSEAAKLAYFTVTAFLFYTCYAVFSVPYQALTYEISPDYNDRTRVMANYTAWYKVGDLSYGWIFPLSQLAIFATPIIGIRTVGWSVGIFILAMIGLIPGLLGRERVFHKAVPKAPAPLRESVLTAIQHKALLIVIALCLLKVVPSMLASSMDHYLLVYYMNGGDVALGTSWKAALSTAYGVVGLVTIPVLAAVANRWGKPVAMAAVYGLVVIAGFGKWFLFVPGHTWIVLCDALFSAPIWVGLSMLLPSMIADICDEDELNTGHRREGVFGAMYNWVVKFGISFAFLGTGLLLDIVGFDAKLGGHQDPSTFFWMRFFFAGVTVISAVLGVVVALAYPITREKATETRRSLEIRRGT